MLINNPRFYRFRALSWTITHRFAVPNDFDACQTPRCAYVLVVKTRRLGRFWPVSWTITQFSGPEVMSTSDEPCGAFTCRSSTLAALADSGPFLGLLLTVLWGPEAISIIVEPRGCVYVSVINTHNFGQFWPSRGLLLTVLGSKSDFHD